MEIEKQLICHNCRDDIDSPEDAIHCDACGHDFCPRCDHVEEEDFETDDIAGTEDPE